MRESTEKKKRAPNYSNREKRLLLEIIVDFTNIVENKKTDAKSCQEKANAWDRVTKVFNFRSTDDTRRSKESLRKYYENLKGTVKKQMLGDKLNTNKTQPEEVADDKCKEMILGMINQATIDYQSNDDDEFIPESPSSFDSHDGSLLDNLKLEGEDNSDEEDYELDEIEINSEDTEIEPVASPYNGYRKVNIPPDVTCRDQGRQLNMDYAELAKLKMSLYKEQIQSIERRNIREEEIHQLKKRKLLLEIKKTRLEIKKINKT